MQFNLDARESEEHGRKSHRNAVDQQLLDVFSWTHCPTREHSYTV